MKKVLLIIAHKNYQPLEYSDTKAVLLANGIKVITASNREGYADSTEYEGGVLEQVDLVLAEVKPEDYDGIFLIGGRGAIENLDNEEVYGIIKKTVELKKVFGAICVSTRILAKTGVLFGKKATGWNGDDNLGAILKNVNAFYVHEPVVVDENLITATGPSSAEDFGQAIVEKLKD